ncbi:TPA: alginate export family protein [Serratia marcescens]|uniref:alginate export family protein n=1 Tax=Serratia marcescens TaxID=615 RepID=UPI0002AF3088|nr:alginate export family protein [Serratia marcescens]AGE19034.1 hypothetical protein SMWW4_v1c32400 [Serratia marcescens WW4]HEI9792371.1 alginate export family protein [Serratia marcescens]
MMKRTLPALLLFSTLPALAAEPAASPWKNIPLGDAATLSFDGSLRERYEWTDQRDLNGGRDDTFMQRLLVGARLDYGDYFGAYVQVGSSLAAPRDRGRKPTDEDHAYLGQGYVDMKLPTAYGLGTLRVGRQEIALGSLHLLGTRDGPNVRRSFDAIRASWVKDKNRLDAFIGHPVTLKTGSFDDDTDNSQKVWGLYGTTPLTPLASSLDLYTFGFEDNDAHYAQLSGQERRYTVGARIFGAARGFDWDNEAAWQFGSAEQRDIRAWSASAHAGYTVSDWRWQPRFGGKIGIASGDKNGHDGQLNTFNAMYPKLPYLTENGLVAPANLIAIHPSVTITPWQTLAIDFSWDALWRQRREDAFYLGPMRPVKGSEQGSRFIGNQYQVETTWTPRSDLQFKVAYVYFDVGHSLQHHAGLKDMNFVLAQGTYSF